MRYSTSKQRIVFYSAFLVVITQVSSGFAQSVEPKVPNNYRIARLLYGCWIIKRPKIKSSPWPASQSIRCFQRGRALYGSTSDAGDGWDFCERWRINGDRLVLRDNYGNEELCSFTISEDVQKLILRGCQSSGDWQRLHKSMNNPSCRTQD